MLPSGTGLWGQINFLDQISSTGFYSESTLGLMCIINLEVEERKEYIGPQILLCAAFSKTNCCRNVSWERWTGLSIAHTKQEPGFSDYSLIILVLCYTTIPYLALGKSTALQEVLRDSETGKKHSVQNKKTKPHLHELEYTHQTVVLATHSLSALMMK